MDAAMSLRFDKLRFVKRLQEANQTPEMAEAFANALDEALEQSQSPLATKADLQLELEKLKNEINTTIFKAITLNITILGFLMAIMKFIN
ncbi:TPA: hypothetical protein PXF07_000454 [Mannheimia haemolytica]|uniref:DUF1640 domain-containing protein n=2 Tax=Mannheimia haemolytica TaxID=75985 RepID=A0A249A2J2_MANHA|nr:hypothetical protein [Mannheimia haemolytica]AWW71934.1 hypothetical protein C4O86_09195 [Pasteurellaceae bacterium 12565]AGI33199.1 hypothetical protein D650_19300 [Mannheimia haemolytica USDA-ARS-USMARC-183]AGI34834.1 hypothetical protein D648_8300 [Mannheimia haemolytica USDA-ARS-USMARC-185]AGK01883.1 hypothetical protein MHH_c14320 [Mannheimia haemolytica M42548]AGQ26670.1 hypothetical protein F382_12225 [Mannheimia haemolytica D153]